MTRSWATAALITRALAADPASVSVSDASCEYVTTVVLFAQLRTTGRGESKGLLLCNSRLDQAAQRPIWVI